MHALIEHLLASRRKGWFREQPIWHPYAIAGDIELEAAEERAGVPLPDDLLLFLRSVGFGDISDEDLSFRLEWFNPVESGTLKGAALFAQDGLGNFYAFVPPENRIVYFARREHVFAEVAPSFRAFMQQLQNRDYRLLEWIASFKLSAYDWNPV